MASANFKLSSNGGSTYAAVGAALADALALAYAASGTYSIKAALDSSAGVRSISWTITSADDEHVASLPTVTSNVDNTCTFSVPKTGGAWLLRCQVNGGVNVATGATDAALTRAMAIKVLTSGGQQVIAVGETDESGSYGWTKAVNTTLRAVGTSASPDDFWPISIDGARSENSGAAVTALAGAACYSDLTLSNSGTSLSMAGYRLTVTGTLTVGAGCILHNDSPAGGSGQTGTTGAPIGELATSTQVGANGGNANSTGGSSGGNATFALGGAGGAGGTGAQSGGAAPTATAPVASTHGTVWTRLGLEFLCTITGQSFQKCKGGAGGAGGGGGAASTGAGGGGGGGLAWIRAKAVVNSGRISCRGGSGNSGAGTNAGGGGGGGGGFIVVWCDSWTGSAPDCAGGSGSAGNGTGTAGSTGSAGKVLVFVKGVLKFRSGFGANAPDINNL
jgi:hypothetical protein